MADKSISDLIQALQITGEDLFVLEQNGEAKKLKGEQLMDFITLNVVSVTVTTLPAGSSATATYDTSTNTLALGIPQGQKGDTGETGATGPANVLTIGSVTSGNVANATITGEAPNQVLNLVLEKGEQGPEGPVGGSSNYVRYDAAQTLTDAQKSQARENIAAGSAADLAKKPDAVMGTMTIHVAKTGSDTTGDGSAEHPFLTIQHAVDLLPKCLQQRVNIAVHAGQYNEDVSIVNFFGGEYLRLYGISGETVSIKTLEVIRCSTSMIYLENFSVFDEINAPYNYSIHLENLINVRMESISTTQSVSNQSLGAVYAREVAHFYMYGCTISNKQIALDIGGTIAYLNNTVTGSGNTVGIRCGSGYPCMGGFVQKGGASLGGTEVKEFGGQIW